MTHVGVYAYVSLYAYTDNLKIIFNNLNIKIIKMKNLTEIKKEYELIPECEINNLLKCSANDLLFELGYCMWCIEKGNDTEYIKQLRDFIVTQCIYNLTFAYGE